MSDTLVLTLGDMQRLAARQSPFFLAARLEADIARGDLRQASLLRFNPDLSVVAPGSGDETDPSPYELTLTQEVEWAGQRGLRKGAARLGVARASASVRDAGRLVVAEATIAFYRALAAERRLAVADELFLLAERLAGAVRIQQREGEISTLEANLAEIEFGRARARVRAARRILASALLEARRVIGVAPDVLIRLMPSDEAAHQRSTGLDVDSLVTVALARRPDLAARTAAMEEAGRLAALAGREAAPNVRVGALAERDRATGDGRIGLLLGLAIPVFNRNQGLVAAQRARVQQAAWQARAVELQVRTQVTDAVGSLEAASDELAILESSVLEPARQNASLLEAAYRAGKIPLPTLLLLRNQLVDAELQYWDAWLVRREALVQLDSATGALLSQVPDSTDLSPSPREMSR
ncbi:MAG: TolC family protein [Gemmatimonadales bacterium]|nr:TolC family protein [Gemmatimonadales bacterium]